MNSEICRLYLKIFEYIIKDQYVCCGDFKQIDLDNDMYIKDLNDIYIGAEVILALNTTHKLCEEAEKDFRLHCLKFYIELCKNPLKKFDFENDFLKCVEYLSPANVIKGQVKSISKLCSFVPTVIGSENIQEVDDEWRELRHFNFKQCNLLQEKSIERFWEVVLSAKRCNGSEMFPFLKKFVYAVLSVTVSTANVERIFSQINLNKNKTRNRLEVPTLCGILRTKDFLKKNKSNCTNFVPTKEMQLKLNKSMYK